MYRKFMSSQQIDFVSGALPYLQVETEIEDNPLNFWVCYGSFVLNQQTSKSDLDLLFVHQTNATPTRIQARYEGFPVTIYSLPLKELVADGSQRRYGGYFSGKLLNPFVVFSESHDAINVSMEAMGGFIGNLAATIAKEHGREIATRDNLVADSVLAYLRLCPFYKAYFLRYYISSNFDEIWDHMRIVVPNALMKARVVTMLSEDSFEYSLAFSPEQFHLQLVTSIARFWAFGSCCHDSNIGFPDYYFQKAQEYIGHNGLQEQSSELLEFLERKAT